VQGIDQVERRKGREEGFTACIRGFEVPALSSSIVVVFKMEDLMLSHVVVMGSS